MKTRRKTEQLIGFCRARLRDGQRPEPPEMAEFSRLARDNRLRISSRLLETVRHAAATSEMNRLLHELSGEIKDRVLMTLLYDILDRIAKQTTRSRSMPSLRRRGRQKNLEEQLISANPLRHTRISEALREEARLRGLPDEPEVWPHHCHIWKTHFSYSTRKKLQTLLEMDEEAFSLAMYRFLADLAGAARAWRLLSRFDWQQFTYSGFTEKDLTALFDPRQTHLKTLQLSAEAGEVEIRKRYKELARLHHPDHGGDAATMAGINLAYTALTRRDPTSF